MDKWGIQLSDWVENIGGKGGIVRCEQFLIFPQCFQKLSVVNASICVYMEQRVNPLRNNPWFTRPWE